MRRREVLVLLAAAAASLPRVGVTQERRIAKVGFVTLHGPSLLGEAEHFRAGLKDLGWVEGRNLALSIHFTSGDRERTREVLRGLVAEPVDVIVVWTTPVAQAAREATATVPVVMIASDPLAAGLVQSLARPGGNLTGVSMSGPDLVGKRLELIREVIPNARTVAFLGSARSAGATAFVRELDAAASAAGMRMVSRLVDGQPSIDAEVFAAMKRDGAQAVIAQPGFTSAAEQIVRLAGEAGLPVVSDYPPFAKAGAIFSYGVDEAAQVRRTAYFVDRILKGAKPAELPVELPAKFQLVVNLRAAKALGLRVPETVIARADEVIE